MASNLYFRADEAVRRFHGSEAWLMNLAGGGKEVRVLTGQERLLFGLTAGPLFTPFVPPDFALLLLFCRTPLLKLGRKVFKRHGLTIRHAGDTLRQDLAEACRSFECCERSPSVARPHFAGGWRMIEPA